MSSLWTLLLIVINNREFQETLNSCERFKQLCVIVGWYFTGWSLSKRIFMNCSLEPNYNYSSLFWLVILEFLSVSMLSWVSKGASTVVSMGAGVRHNPCTDASSTNLRSSSSLGWIEGLASATTIIVRPNLILT